MANRIRGITVQLGGDTSGLKKALSEADSALAATNKELREVQKGLKLDPGNTKLAAQQHTLLANAVKQTSDKLRALEDNQSKVDKAFKANKAWEAQYAPIKKRIEETSEALKKLRSSEEDFKKKHESGEISDKEYEDFTKALKEAEEAAKAARKEKTELDKKFTDGHINAEQYREYEREVEKTRAELNKLEGQLDESGKAAKGNASDMKSAANAMNDMDKAADEANEAVGKFSDDLKKDVKDAAKVVAALTAAILAVGKASVDAGMEFDSSMSNVMATLGYSTDEINTAGTEAAETYKVLRDYAQQMGKSTKFSATESGDAFNYMAMAGWNSEQMLDGLGGILDLAAASGSELAATSDIVTDALTAMGYGVEEAGHLADVMAAASSNANTNVEMMGETFKKAAPVAGALGFTMEDTAFAIGLMANSGIKASNAGTQLAKWFSRLAAPTTESKEAMEKLNLSLTDGEGNIKSFRQVIIDTRTAFSTLSEAQQTQYAKMLAGQEGMSGLLAIVNAAPADFDKLTNAIDNSAGAAEQMANVRIDNLEGDITIMKSAAEGAQIAISDKLTPSLRKYTQIGTKVISSMTDAFGKKGLNGAIDAAHQTLKKEMGDDANAIFAAEGAVKALVAAFLAYRGVMLLTDGITALQKVNDLLYEGKTLTEAMAGAKLANPWILLATAVAAVGMALKSAADMQISLIDETADAYADLTEEQQAVIDKANDTAQAIYDSNGAFKDSITSIENNEKKVDALVDRLYELDEVEDKSTAQKAEMAAIVDELNGSVEGLNLKYDEQTGKLDKNREAVDKLVDSYFEEAKAEAYKNRLVKLIDEKIDAELAHEEAVKAVEKAQGKQSAAQNRVNSLTAKYNRNLERITELENEMSGGYWTEEKQAEYDSLVAKNKEVALSLEDVQAELDNTENGMGDLLAAQITAKDALDTVNGSIDATKEKMEGMGDEVAEEAEAIVSGMSDVGDAYDDVSEKAGDTHDDIVWSLDIGDELDTALSEIETLIDEYNTALEQRTGTLQNWFEKSVTVSDEELSMSKLWGALNQTENNLDAWQKGLDKLADSGINKGFLKTLEDAGPDSLALIQTLLTVPAEERNRYAEEWEDTYSGLDKIAEEQLSEMKTATDNEIEAIMKSVEDKQEGMHDVFKQLGFYGADGYIKAFSDESKRKELKDVVDAYVQTAIDQVAETQNSDSPAKEFTEKGEDGGDGYVVGIKNKETEVQKAAREMTEAALNAVGGYDKNASSGLADSIAQTSAAVRATTTSLGASAAPVPAQSSTDVEQLVRDTVSSLVSGDVVVPMYVDSDKFGEIVIDKADIIYGRNMQLAMRGY